MATATHLQELLGLASAPVGVWFRASAPADVPRVGSAAPSGCSYWKHAADGHTFATIAADHFHCPIGAYTHGVDLPEAQLQELQAVVTTMTALGYIRREEVAGIPRRAAPFGAAVYGPFAEEGEPPDVVLVRGNARQMMLLEEAAQGAGISGAAPLMGRPTCAAIPLVLSTGCTVSSLACIGNRVYTELPDGEFYHASPGQHLATLVAHLARIVQANAELEKYHRARRHALGV